MSSNDNEIDKKEEEPIFICPNCQDFIIIKKINCGIFRHAILKKNGKQIDPHSSQEQCDNYIKNNLIYGCGKPFQIAKKENSEILEIIICDYI
jgi:predicted RNA-binding Zn-ribbon protein involved in translation (DUF1610 family)